MTTTFLEYPRKAHTVDMRRMASYDHREVSEHLRLMSRLVQIP
jgi:hypothetical protein